MVVSTKTLFSKLIAIDNNSIEKAITPSIFALQPSYPDVS